MQGQTANVAQNVVQQNNISVKTISDQTNQLSSVGE
jgi:hypothetical protein